MKVIITENQKVQAVKNLIKTQGWSESQKFFDYRFIVKSIFNNNPMEFLSTFDDLEVVQSGERPELMLYRYKDGWNLMVHDTKKQILYVQFSEIWDVLKKYFDTDYYREQIIKHWAKKSFGIDFVHYVEYFQPWSIRTKFAFIV
jgi:hypothetical protein